MTSKRSFVEGQEVWLREDPIEGWKREKARILESGTFGRHEMIIVQLIEWKDDPTGPIDDGLRETMVSDIEEVAE